MKAGWHSNRTLFCTVLQQFQQQVADLAYQMFDGDEDGELPIFVRIVDRTAFRLNEDVAPFDVGMPIGGRKCQLSALSDD